MRPYEALVILRASGTEAEAAQAVAQLEEPITRSGGRIGRSVSWGRRRLAYRIARQSEGYYHLVQFHLPPQQLEAVKRTFHLNETIVRFLILNRTDHHEAVAAPTSASETRVSTAAPTLTTTPKA